MNLLTRRVGFAVIRVWLCGWVCLSLSAQQTATPDQQTASPAQQATTPAPADPTSPTAQPATPAQDAQEPAGTPDDSKPTQNPDGTYTIQRNVRLVVLDMVVTDAKGNVVTNLSSANFHVEEEGQPQEIQNFEPAGAHTLDPQVTIDSTADLDRLPQGPRSISSCWMSSTRGLKTWPSRATR